MLKGRLGLEGARIPHADRHGLLWLGRGSLYVEDGTLRFRTVGTAELVPGDHAIPYQMVSCILAGPGTTLSHDALRILARHGTGVLAVGEGGTRLYASMPFGPDDSKLARRQVEAWSRADTRLDAVRRMYAWRLGEILPQADLNALRGIEGSRVKETYRLLAERHGIPWHGRRYDRNAPSSADLPNQAINHAASAAQAAAMIAVAATGTIPQLGFIHEDSGVAFCLDIADLVRDSLTVTVAFAATRQVMDDRNLELERVVRGLAARAIKRDKVIPTMIDRIKGLFDADDSGRDR